MSRAGDKFRAAVAQPSMTLEEWRQASVGSPVCYYWSRGSRAGVFAGVSRAGNIMIDVPYLKTRQSIGYRAVRLRYQSDKTQTRTRKAGGG